MIDPAHGSEASQTACLVCKSESTQPFAVARDIEYYSSGQSFEYRVCSECGCVSLPVPPISQLNVIYPSNYYSYQPQVRSWVGAIKDRFDLRLFSWCLARLPDRALTVLDVGGGVGSQLELIRTSDQRVHETTIVDIDAAAQTLATANGHAFFCQRIEEFQNPAKFDLILALNLIEHVSDPVRVLGKLHECLTPEGLLVIKTPNLDSLDARLFRHHNWGGYHCPRHWVLFTEDTLRSMCAKIGLTCVHFEYTQGAPFWAVSCLGWLRKWRFVRLDSDHPAYRHPLYPFLIIIFAVVDFARKPWSKTSQMFFVLQRKQDRQGS